MATAVEVKITVDGSQLEGFISLSIRQTVFYHNTFELNCRSDALERFSSSADSFILDKAQKLIGKKISVEVSPTSKRAKSKSAVIMKGIILEVQGNKYEDAFSGSILLRGSSFDMFYDSTTYCRSFQDKSLDTIVKKVTADYPSNLFAKTNVSSRYTQQIPYIVQYNETNYDFLRRLAATYGEWLLVTGENHFYFGEPPTSKTQLLHGLDLHEFSLAMKLAPVKYAYTGYSYYQEGNIEKNSSILQPRTSSFLKQSYDLSDNTYSVEEKFFYNHPLSKSNESSEVEHAVKTGKKARVAGLNLATGSTDNHDLSLGCTVKIEGLGAKGASGKKVNFGEYRIISLYHSCDEGGNYMNHFEAVPVSIEVPPHVNPLTFPACDTQGAVVTDTNDPEGMGRIKVRFFWQDSSEESPWLRIITPYAGDNKGIFFVPEIGEEVLVGFENRNAEKPFILGAHFNGKKKPDDWKGSKNDKKAIRTRSGHTIEFNDESGKEEITIYDKDNVNTIVLSSHGKEMTVTCKGDLKIEAQNIQVTAHKDYTLKVDGKINISSMKETEIAATGKCTVKTSQDMSLEAMSNLKAKANASAEISGATVAAKGQATAELSSGAATTVKGAIVQIN
jgi:type VI secretion system secreted protein VgrG